MTSCVGHSPRFPAAFCAASVQGVVVMKHFLRSAAAVSVLFLAGCGEGWVMQDYTGTPYGDRTAGKGVQYVRAKMLPEKGPVIEAEMEEHQDVILPPPQDEPITSGDDLPAKIMGKEPPATMKDDEKAEAAPESSEDKEVKVKTSAPSLLPEPGTISRPPEENMDHEAQAYEAEEKVEISEADLKTADEIFSEDGDK